jgi:hypothetical protein
MHSLHLLRIFTVFCVLPLAAQSFSTKSYTAHGSQLLTADFNRDGFTDLLEYGNPNTPVPAYVAVNDGQGGFATGSLITSNPVAAAAVADLNHDGYPDIAACVVTSPANAFPPTYAVNVYLNQSGNGQFALSQSIPLPSNTGCVGITAGDINRDGHTDVVTGVSGGSGDQLITYFGSSTGQLGPGIQQAVSLPLRQSANFTCSLNGLAAADYTGTGRYDLMLFGGCSFVTSTGDLYYAASAGNGQYTLTDIFEGTGLLQVAPRLANVNNDLLPDLSFVVSNFDHPGNSYGTFVATNQGSGKFTVQLPFSEIDGGGCNNFIGGAGVADFNGDGNPDIVNSATVPPTGCGSSVLPGVVLLTGNGQGTWQISQESDLPSNGTSPPSLNMDAVSADFNNDNRADFALIAQDQNGTNELLVYTNTSSFSVNPCLPSGPGAHLCTPSQVTASSEHFTAAATGLTGPVRLMQLYVDGKKVGQFPGNQINASVTLVQGTHTAQVVELEYNGEFSKSAAIIFTVK